MLLRRLAILIFIFALTSPYILAAQQSRPEVDNAAKRAQDFLEDALTKLLVIRALHLELASSDLLLPKPMTTTTRRDPNPKELPDGAQIAFTYDWHLDSAPSKQFTDVVNFHCDRMGRIDAILSVTSTNPSDTPFREFAKVLSDKKYDVIESLIEQWIKNENEKSGNPKASGERSFYQEFAAKMIAFFANMATEIGPRETDEFLLGLSYDFGKYSRMGYPKYGLDGFQFGQASTHALRTKVEIPLGEVQRAIPKILADFAARFAKTNEEVPRPDYPYGVVPDYSRQIEGIAAAAQNCARITAHQAFQVTSYGGKGEENLFALGSDYTLCRDSQRLRPLGNSPDSAIRPIYFSVTPAGRGFRDANGMRLELRYATRASDPPFPADEAFDHYGIMSALIPQSEVPCADPPGGGTPPDRKWKQDGSTNILTCSLRLRIRRNL